jgi:hypothetical protein
VDDVLALSDLIDFLLELMRDPAASAEFEADPDGALAARGLEGVTAQDVRDARLELCDVGGASATGDAAATHGNDPIREINHTTHNYSASAGYAPHVAAHEHAALAVQAASPVTIDDRDTFFIQNNVSDDDVTIVNDSFNQDNDTSVTAIRNEDSFNNTTDVTAIRAEDSFNQTDVGDVTQVGDVTTGAPGVIDGTDPAVVDPDVTGVDPDGPAVSGPTELPDDPAPDADPTAVDEPVDEPVEEPEPEPVVSTDPVEDDPADLPGNGLDAEFDPVA